MKPAVTPRHGGPVQLWRASWFALAVCWSSVLAVSGAPQNPLPVRSARSGLARVPARELARQLADSIDAGDAYLTPSGPHTLRRLAGVVVVRSPFATGAAKPGLTAPGQPLEGYVAAGYRVRDFNLYEASPQEKRRQLQQPDRLRLAVEKTRSVSAAKSANPMFLDPHSGLRLFATEQIVVCLRPGTDPKNYFGRRWKNVRPVRGASDQFILTLPGAAAEEILAESNRRARHRAVAWAEPDMIRQAVKCSIPDDPYFAARQWHLQNTGQRGGRPGADARLPAAWDITTGNANVTIAFLDDGTQIHHPDLAANLFTNPQEIPDNRLDDDHNGLVDDVHGFDFFNQTSDPGPSDPDDNHGTSVVGVAAAVGNNGLGVAGAAYGCRFLPLKVIEGDFLLPDSELAAALRYAAGLNDSPLSSWRGADIVSISLGFDPSFVVNKALTDVASRGRQGLGCPIFVAAGNSAAAWQLYELPIASARNYTLRWEYSKDASFSDGDDTVWLDGISYPGGAHETFENGGLPDGWTTSPTFPWTNVQDDVAGNRALTGWDGAGSRSLRAGHIGPNQTSYVEVTRFLEPGVLRFWFWVSSEPNYDFFRFYADGTQKVKESGVPLTETAVGYPARYPACLAVGASTDFDYRADYSQYGVALDFLAPSDGGASSIFTTDRTGTDGYNRDSSPAGDYMPGFGGTSSATPLAAATAALVLSVNPHLAAQEVRALLRGACDKIGGVDYDASGRNAFYGSGRIDAARAASQARANLNVTISASRPLASVGDLSTYTVTVGNHGPSRSGPITLTNWLPEGAVFAASAPAPAGRGGGLLVLTNASLAAGAMATFKITVTHTVPGTQLDTVTAASDVLESDLEDNAANATVVVFPTPVVSIHDARIVEGNTGATNLLFEVNLSNPSDRTVTVRFATSPNTASAGSDFTSRHGTISFAPGETNQTLTIRIRGDSHNEVDESFSVGLTNAINATLGRAQATGVIVNDDPLPGLSLSNVVLTEGNTGARDAVFQVQLSVASGRPITVNYATAPGTARAGTDFIATNGMLTFQPGNVRQKIIVKVLGDIIQESNVTFFVNLGEPLNAVLAQAQGQCTILNNDKPPKLFIDDVTLTEGDLGQTNAVFTVRLLPASGLPVTVDFATTNGSATGGLDFMPTNGSIHFALGETNQTIPVAVFGDLLSESNETFFVRLSDPTNATLGRGLGRATILDNDPPLLVASLGAGQPLAVPVPLSPAESSLEINFAKGEIRLRFIASPGRRYRVERCDDLRVPDGWQPLPGAEEISGTGQVVELFDPEIPRSRQAFYRLRQL